MQDLVCHPHTGGLDTFETPMSPEFLCWSEAREILCLQQQQKVRPGDASSTVMRHHRNSKVKRVWLGQRIHLQLHMCAVAFSLILPATHCTLTLELLVAVRSF